MGQIKLGMHLVRADGRVGVVTGWKVVAGSSVMYNLEVAQDHTFTVGSGQWVVHNCTGDPPGGWIKSDYGPDNKPGVTDFEHIDEAGNKLEATLYDDSRELQIPWMDSLSQAKTHLPELVNWLGDNVQTVKGYVTGNLATRLSPESNGLAAVNRMFGPTLEGSGFARISSNQRAINCRSFLGGHNNPIRSDNRERIVTCTSAATEEEIETLKGRVQGTDHG